MARDNAENDKELSKTLALANWRRELSNDRANAERRARSVIADMVSQNLHSAADRARYFAQMINGVAAPSDFARNSHGFPTTA